MTLFDLVGFLAGIGVLATFCTPLGRAILARGVSIELRRAQRADDTNALGAEAERLRLLATVDAIPADTARMNELKDLVHRQNVVREETKLAIMERNRDMLLKRADLELASDDPKPLALPRDLDPKPEPSTISASVDGAYEAAKSRALHAQMMGARMGLSRVAQQAMNPEELAAFQQQTYGSFR